MEQWIYCLVRLFYEKRSVIESLLSVILSVVVWVGSPDETRRMDALFVERWIYCSWNNGSIVWSNNRLLFYYENALLSRIILSTILSAMVRVCGS